jgi:hypothetical protein
MSLMAVIALAVLASGSATSCSTATPKGTATGTLQLEGGPAGAATEPVPGSVDITPTGAGTAVHTEITGTDGKFEVSLKAGTYTFVGHSPMFGDNAAPCSGPSDLSLAKSQTVTVTIICQRQ